MDTKLLELQRQIKENSMSLSDYFKDLHQWEKEINNKDKIIKTQGIPKTKEKKEKYSTDSEREPMNINKEATSNTATRILKRDVNSIKDYYDAWNRVNIDKEELKDKEEHPSQIDNQNGSLKKEIFTNPKKVSNAQANTSIIITNNRKVVNQSNLNEYVEKLKTEANGYFAIGNYNKSVELNISALNLLDSNKNPDLKAKLKISICNNKGNSHLKLNNYKEAIKDFNFVLENEKNNLKALFRRGYSYFKLGQFIKAIEDLQLARDLSEESDKNSISRLINESINEINSTITKERKKMENFEYSDNLNFIKVKPIDVNIQNFDEQSNVDLRQYLLMQNKNTSNVENKKENEVSRDTGNKSNQQVRDKILIPIVNSEKIISSDEIKKFVYDMTKENLTASSFKFAFRNFGDNWQEKEQFLLKVNPNYLPQIFVNDIDKNVLIEILNCLKSILNRQSEE